MTKHNNARHVLVIRPWLGTISGGEAYAHFDALAMQETPAVFQRCYGGYEIIQSGDDGRKVLLLDNFRFQCQTDDRRPESYAWEWGYQPAHRGIFTRRDMERYGPSIAAIDRTLKRLHREDGPAETVGRLVVRLARALKLHGIVLIETSQNGGFRSDMQVRRSIDPLSYGDAIRVINDLVTELHRACAQRLGKSAA